MSAGADYKALYEQSQLRNADLQLQVLELSRQLDQLKKMIFGSRHERFIPSDPTHPQLSLDINAEPLAAGTITSTKQISYTLVLLSLPTNEENKNFRVVILRLCLRIGFKEAVKPTSIIL